MVSVQLRNNGQGVWRVMTLPTTVQAAQTLAGAARTLDLADQVRILPSAPASGRSVDIKV